MHDQRNPRGVPAAHHVFLGEAIRRHRVTAKLSVEELADEAHMRPAYLLALEAGEIPATYDVLRRVADALVVPTSSLVWFAETLGHVDAELADGDD